MLVLNDNHRIQFHFVISTWLSFPLNALDSNEYWERIKQACRRKYHAVLQTIHVSNDGCLRPLLLCQILAYSFFSEAKYKKRSESLRREVGRSLRNEQQWIRKCKSTKKPVNIIFDRSVYPLLRNTGPRKSGVSGWTKQSDGLVIHSQECRMERCA